MPGALLVAMLVLAGAAPPSPNVDARIAASAAAAQALQGPLDGTWRLTDTRGRLLFVLQIVDPATGGALQCAWRDPRGTLGAAACERRGPRLELRLDAASGERRVRLRHRRSDAWRGSLSFEGGERRVTMTKPFP